MPTMLSLTKAGLLATLFVLVISAGITWSVTGREEPEGREGRDGDLQPPQHKNLPPVATAFLVIEIKEDNRDTFKHRLTPGANEHAEPPFELEQGKLFLLDKIANETGAAKLKEHGLKLG